MRQDDLEEEVIVRHLRAASFSSSDLVRSLVARAAAFCCGAADDSAALLMGLATVVALYLLFNHVHFIPLPQNLASLLGLTGGGGGKACYESDEGEVVGGAVGVWAVQGRRATMEDRFVLERVGVPGGAPPVVVAAVLDGHGGEVRGKRATSTFFNSIQNGSEMQFFFALKPLLM